ncbi:Hypothetical predicted protein [Marmota monax]|uniref:Vomeronasal type-1 receptor n=1 Tax=Marmota monax TaxID=9995 RepID=A0A5E4CUL1_MARMO|nr:hypothetical protein GHT09_017850 [Marmota monax]VTJ85538.1 Hypothetical predicted protein [Marmota monax]
MTGDMIIAAVQGGSWDLKINIVCGNWQNGPWAPDPGVGRGMSFSSTCLLSVFQAITISPRDSRWVELQVKAPRHKQRFQHLHGNSPSPRSSPESRATQTILLLVGTFVSLYTLSFTIHLWWGVSGPPSQRMLHLSALINAVSLLSAPLFS